MTTPQNPVQFCSGFVVNCLFKVPNLTYTLILSSTICIQYCAQLRPYDNIRLLLRWVAQKFEFNNFSMPNNFRCLYLRYLSFLLFGFFLKINKSKF